MVPPLRSLGFLFLVLLALIPRAETYGATIFWKGSQGGDWNTNTNWVGDVVPTSNDLAWIAQGSSVLNAPAQVKSLDLGQGGTPGYLALSTGAVLMTNNVQINSGNTNSVLTVGQGSQLTNSGNLLIGYFNNCAEKGTLNISGGKVTTLSLQVAQDSGSALTVSNGGELAAPSITGVSCRGGPIAVVPTFDRGIFTTTSNNQNVSNIPISTTGAGLTANTAGNSNYFANQINGDGGVAVVGGGKIKYTNVPKNYSGPTTISNAELVVNTNVPNSNFMVQSGGILSGLATAGGNVVAQSGGVISPGDSDVSGGIGTLTTGPLTMNAGSTLKIQLASTTNYDVLRVNGLANLNGATVDFSTIEGFTPGVCNEPITFLQASGGVTGTFGSVTGAPAPYFLKYNPDNVQLIIPCLEEAVIKDTAPSLVALEVPVAQLVPVIDRNIKDIIFNVTNTQYWGIVTRLAAIRAGVSGMSFQGLSKEPMIEQYSKREAKNVNSTLLTTTESSGWDIFASASGVFSKINSACDLPRINSTTGYFSVGADYQINPCINVGIYTGYQGIMACYSDGSRLRSNGVKFGLYATAQYPGFSGWNNFDLPRWASQWINFPPWACEWNDNFYVNAILGGGANFFNINRCINVRSRYVRDNRTARSYPFGGELDSLLGAGYEFNLGAWRFGVNTSIQYTYLGINAFNESGARNLNVRTFGQDPNSLIYTLGANISYLWQITPCHRIFPTVGLYWQHEFLNYGQRIRGRFANGRGATFNFYSTTAPRNNAFGVAGITAEIGPRLGAYAYYNPQFGGGQIVSQGVIVGVTYSF